MLITNVTGNFFLKENDTATEMHLAVQEVDGTPIDLSAASKVEVVIGTLEGRYLTKTPTLLDKTGEFTFGLDEGDMLPTGDNLLEVHIFDNNNSKRVAPSKGHYKLKVQRTIGALGLTVTTYTLDYFLSEVNRILFGLPQLLARGEALADRMDVLIEESEQGLDEMYTATDASRTATANSIEATAAAELATQDAQRATVEADTATAEAIQATTEADNATRDSIAQTQAANTATSGANAATMRANTAAGEAEFQAFQAENATVDAQDATRAANTATDNANAASSRANTSAGRADTATTNATNAANAANTAATEANAARDSANLAASLADGIATELRGYDNAIATFSLETRYLKHQPVRFDGSTYKAKVETQGNPLPVAPARSNEWFDLVSEKGEKGDMGTGINILGKVGSVSELPASGSPGDAYLIGVNIHIWDGDGWLDGGPIQGPQGEIGPQGEVGVGLQYSWNGSQLGVKRADESTYTYRDLQGPQGLKGDNAKIITLDFIIPATDGTQVDGNLINVHDYVYDAAADSIQFYQNSRILYPGEDFEMEDGTFRLLNWTGYDDPANVTFYIKVTRSVFDIDPVQSHATVVGALGYTPARSEDITQVVYDLEEADTRLTAQLAQTDLKIEGTETDLDDRGVNLRSLGAVLDGISDDYQIVMNALSTYKNVIVPRGAIIGTSETIKIDTGQSLIGAVENIRDHGNSCKIKYIGTLDRKKAVVILGKNEVGAEPALDGSDVVFQNIVVDCNNKAGFGVYGTYITNETKVKNILAIGSLEYAVYFAKCWYAEFSHLYAIKNKGRGIALGMPLEYDSGEIVNWTSESSLEMNNCEIEYLRANRNGETLAIDKPNTYNPTNAALRRQGYGIGFGVGNSFNVSKFTSESNGGAGVYIYTISQPLKTIKTGYLERNCLNSGLDSSTSMAGMIIENKSVTGGNINIVDVFMNYNSGGIFHTGVLGRKVWLRNVQQPRFLKSLDGLTDNQLYAEVLKDSVYFGCGQYNTYELVAKGIDVIQTVDTRYEFTVPSKQTIGYKLIFVKSEGTSPLGSFFLNYADGTQANRSFPSGLSTSYVLATVARGDLTSITKAGGTGATLSNVTFKLVDTPFTHI